MGNQRKFYWWIALTPAAVTCACLALVFAAWYWIVGPPPDQAANTGNIPATAMVQTEEVSSSEENTNPERDEQSDPSDSALDPSPTASPISNTPTPPPAAPASPENLTATPLPSTLTCTNRAYHFADLSIPDGTVFTPGESFEKSWGLQNAGSCAWDRTYKLVYTRGDQLGSQATLPLAAPVQPDDVATLDVPMLAPLMTGVYTSYWQMQAPDGAAFGPEVWVNIKVTALPLEFESAYDFIDMAGQAIWLSGDQTYEPVEITSLLDEGSEAPSKMNLPPEGVVTTGVAQVNPEIGEEFILVTHPHQEHGFIQGTYGVAQPVQPTDILFARFGFLETNPTAQGQATFEVSFIPDGAGPPLDLFSKPVTPHDGIVSVTRSLAGIQSEQSGTFTLRVKQDAPSPQITIWLDLRLVRL